MNKVPRWYWPIALVPGVVCALLTPEVLHALRKSRPPLIALQPPELLGMLFALYVALVLLGYLLLVLYRTNSDRR